MMAVEESICELLAGHPAPVVGILSGSGLAIELDEVLWSCSYSDIAGFPASTVKGHPGRLQLGRMRVGDGEIVLLNFQGRLHLYEGWTPEQVTLPIRIMAAFPSLRLVVTTSAVGSVRPENFQTGDLVVLSDHISLPGMLGLGPLMGRPNCFVPMDQVYIRPVAIDGVKIGAVYVGVTGPQYETPAEVAMLKALGADVVGMSTTLEVIEAAAQSLKVLAVAMVTNVAAGQRLSHQEVLSVGATKRQDLHDVLCNLLSSCL